MVGSRTCAGSVEQWAGVSVSPEGNRRLGPRHAVAGSRRERPRELAADCSGIRSLWPGAGQVSAGGGTGGSGGLAPRCAAPRPRAADYDPRWAQGRRPQRAWVRGGRAGQCGSPASADPQVQHSRCDPRFSGSDASRVAVTEIPGVSVNRTHASLLLVVARGRADPAVGTPWTGALGSSPLQHSCWLWLVLSCRLALEILLFLNLSNVVIRSTGVA